MRMSRILDIAVAIAGLLLTAPLMAAIGAVIMVADGRPVLFRQARVTTGCKLFDVLKFRTMSELRDTNGDLLPDAVRLTRIGRALRKSRLDELPQLYNIFAGKMALIGPRPLLPETITQAGERGRLRSAVPPGLTGWAQVNGNTLLSDQDKIALDLWYIANRTVRLDLLILAKTIAVALSGERRSPLAIRRAYESGARRRG